MQYQLVLLSSGPYHTLVGTTGIHPSNHWAYGAYYADVNNAVLRVAEQYWTEYHNDSRYQILGVNDIALPMGGRFDICAIGGSGCSGVRPWQSPHDAHMFGFDVDFRANGAANSIIVDSTVLARFEQICREKGANFTQNEGNHIHCRFFT